MSSADGPAGVWDPPPTTARGAAVMSAVPVHHLDDGGERDLFARVLGALVPGGVLVGLHRFAVDAGWRPA